jgi:branched-chain amino acid transport system substrate-binding protein
MVTPTTGPLAFFGEPDQFVIDQFKAALSEGAGGRPIELIVKDSQSNPSRAAEVASQLILEDEVSLILSSGGPATVNPVADQAEINGVPSLSTACPWQPFVMGRGSTPKEGFESTFLFAFGLEDVIAAYLKLWEGTETNRKVGMLLPNDADGNAWANPDFGFPPALVQARYELVDPGRYTPMSDDYSNFVSAFKSEGVDIVMGSMLPPEFLTFWAQAGQQGLSPKIATVGKCLLLPTVLDAAGARGDLLSTELGWHPAYPFTSATTGQSAGDIARAWTDATGKPWYQTIGLKHALLDLAVGTLMATDDPEDPESVIAAIRGNSLETTLGVSDFGASPIANVAKSAMMGGQWHKGADGYELEIAANATELPIEVTKPFQVMGG